jgi:transcriptional regulator with XRE-family HTH domain
MKEFGKKFNLAESTISGYENETRKPDLQIINKFSDYFGVNADYLLGRSDNPSPSPSQSDTENEIYIAYLGGPPEEIDEEEAEHLKKELEMFRAFKEKRKRERDQNNIDKK